MSLESDIRDIERQITDTENETFKLNEDLKFTDVTDTDKIKRLEDDISAHEQKKDDLINREEGIERQIKNRNEMIEKQQSEQEQIKKKQKAQAEEDELKREKARAEIEKIKSDTRKDLSPIELETQRVKLKQAERELTRGAVKDVIAIKRASSGVGTLILYGGMAYLAYSVYKKSSFGSPASYKSAWKPLSSNEIERIQKLTG